MEAIPEKEMENKIKIKLLKRAAARAERNVHRERRKLELQIKKLHEEIKNIARKDQHEEGKIITKEAIKMKKKINDYLRLGTILNLFHFGLSSSQKSADLLHEIKVATDLAKKLGETSVITFLKEIREHLAPSSEIERIEIELPEEIGSDSESEAEKEYNQIQGEICSNFFNQFPSDPNHNYMFKNVTENEISQRLEELKKAQYLEKILSCKKQIII